MTKFRFFKKRCVTIRGSILKNFAILIALISFAFFSSIMIIQFAQITMTSDRIVTQSTEELKNGLERFFDPVSKNLNMVSKWARNQFFERLDIKRLNAILVPVMEESPQIVSINASDDKGNSYLLFRSGDRWINREIVIEKGKEIARWYVWDSRLKRISDHWEKNDFDPLRSAWYRQAVDNPGQGPSWTPPYTLDSNGKTGLTVSIPVEKATGGSFVLAFDVLAEDLSKIAGRKRIMEGGMIFVMTDKDEVFEFPEGGQRPVGAKRRERILKSVSELGIPYLTDAVDFWKKRRPRKKHQLFFFNSQRTRWVGSIRPFLLEGEKALRIGMLIPVEDIVHAYSYHTFSIVVIFCLALAMAFLMAKKMSKRYSVPITKLMEQSKRMSRMDLKKCDCIDTDIEELQQMADSQEQMRGALDEATRKLKVSNEKLEHFSQTLSEKVEERTLELQEKSKELEELNQTLEQKVKTEVEASNRKDQIMLQSARQAQMGEMISMIAHQWRQPLSSISTVTGNMLVFLELDTVDKEQFKELLMGINEHAQYLSNTINDFRNFFKPNKNKQTVMLGDILEQTIGIMGKSLEYKSIVLKQEYRFQTSIDTYPNELTQVFLNIIKNAQDVILEKRIKNPEITIQGYEEDGYQTVEISDNAGGIPEEVMEKMFEPYFSTKDEKTGTGLGLYMSKLIIEKHCKGELTADNLENGARFTIKMPA